MSTPRCSYATCPEVAVWERPNSMHQDRQVHVCQTHFMHEQKDSVLCNVIRSRGLKYSLVERPGTNDKGVVAYLARLGKELAHV